MQEAKFKATLVPISQIVLPASARNDVSFNSFFTHIVAHELMHGLEPGTKLPSTDVPRWFRGWKLKEQYAAIEEAKADVTGLFALRFLMTQTDRGQIQSPLPHGPEAERQLYTTYLASAFRTLRFGLTEAHARAMAMQFNYLLDKGAFVADADGTFSVNFDKIKDAVRALDHDLLTIEATGDYAGKPSKLLDQGALRPEVQHALDRLKSLPTDILKPIFTTADSLTNEKALSPAREAPHDE